MWSLSFIVKYLCEYFVLHVLFIKIALQITSLVFSFYDMVTIILTILCSCYKVGVTSAKFCFSKIQ